MDYQAIAMISMLPFSDGKRRDITEETRKDDMMKELVRMITEGWPNDKKNLSSFLKPLWSNMLQRRTDSN